MNNRQISAALKAAGMVYKHRINQNSEREDLSISGSVSVSQDGVLYPGSLGDLIQLSISARGLFTVPFTMVISFTPGFADDGVLRYLVDTDIAPGRLEIIKDASNNLVFYADSTVLGTVASGTWLSLWNTSSKNVIVFTSDLTNTIVWLNGTQILSSGVISYTTFSNHKTLYLGSDNSGANRCFNTVFHFIDVYRFKSSSLDEPYLRLRSLFNSILFGSSLVYLPCKKRYIRSVDSHMVTPVLGSSNISEAELGDGTTTTTFPTLLENKRGFYFDGGDYINIGQIGSFAGGSPDKPFSVCFMLDELTVNSYYLIQYGETIGVDLEWSISYFDSTDIFYFTLYDLSMNYVGRSITSPSKRKKIYVICTYSGGGLATDVKIYMDGNRADNTSDISGVYSGFGGVNTDMLIAKPVGPLLYNGNLSEFYIFPFELSDMQAKVLTSLAHDRSMRP